MEALVHLAIVWFAVYLAVIMASFTRITPVLYCLAIGAVLVNVGILPETSDEFIRGLAEIGILFIMFALGFEETTSNFLNSIKRSWGIALFGALAPFAAAYSVANYFWGDPGISLMCGLTMTATAVSLTMVSLKSAGLERSSVATRIMTSAVLDDIASLALVAMLVPIASGQTDINFYSLVLVGGKTVAFFVTLILIARWVLPKIEDGWTKRLPFIGRYGIDRLLGLEGGQHAALTVLLFALLIGLLAHIFGFHPAIGAYMAGLILKEEFFQAGDTKYSYEGTKDVIDIVSFSIIGPVFFVELGTKLIFEWDVITMILPHIALLTVSVFVTQIVSAGLAARYTSGMSWEGSLMIGFGMLGRAELAFVVMDIAYIQNAILTKEAFFTLMGTAFLLNLAVPLTIAWWKPYYVAKG